MAGQLRKKLILIVIYNVSLLKTGMIARRVFKLFKNWHCVIKAPEFLHFQIAKGGTKTVAHF
jgi:hypothetical protein